MQASGHVLRALSAMVVASTAATFTALPAVAEEPTLMPASVTYADGAEAIARPECGVGELCATITLPDKDTLLIYNRGAQKCGPYTLRLLTLHGDTVVLTSEEKTKMRHEPNSGCTRFVNTYLTVDSGEIRIGVYLAKDGALILRFLSGSR